MFCLCIKMLLIIILLNKQQITDVWFGWQNMTCVTVWWKQDKYFTNEKFWPYFIFFLILKMDFNTKCLTFLYFWWKLTFLYSLGCLVYCTIDVSISNINSQSGSRKNSIFFSKPICHILLMCLASEYYSHNGTCWVRNCTYLSELLFNSCTQFWS